MAAKFVLVDHDTPLLMPPDLRGWVPEGHLVHFIMDAVRLLDVGQARVHERGTGSPQYPPTLILGLLIDSDATGTFSSRQIERATYENVAVRLLCADRLPDHDSICTFRRTNGALLQDSRLLVGVSVTDAPSDKEQLAPTLAVVSPVIESVGAALVDRGYYSAAAVAEAEQPRGDAAGPKIYAATERQPHGRTVQELEKRPDPPPPGPGASPREKMKNRLQTKAGRELYAQRKQTIEPIFGIIKETLGFRRFSLRGLKKAGMEWTLVTLAHNLKRLFHMGAALPEA